MLWGSGIRLAYCTSLPRCWVTKEIDLSLHMFIFDQFFRESFSAVQKPPKKVAQRLDGEGTLRFIYNTLRGDVEGRCKCSRTIQPQRRERSSAQSSLKVKTLCTCSLHPVFAPLRGLLRAAWWARPSSPRPDIYVAFGEHPAAGGFLLEVRIHWMQP